MKSFFVVLMLVMSASLSQSVAQADQSKGSGQWVCWADGEQNFGGPVGPIYQSVVGYGDTQVAAANDAQMNCLGQGLSMCMVSSCHQD